MDLVDHHNVSCYLMQTCKRLQEMKKKNLIKGKMKTPWKQGLLTLCCMHEIVLCSFSREEWVTKKKLYNEKQLAITFGK